METFIDYCKNYVLEHLSEHEGREVYLCDLGFTLTEYPNCNGTLTYSREEAKNYLREWWNEADDYFRYEKDNFGTARNPFENPEAYMVCMVIEGVRELIDAALGELNLDYNEKEVLSPDTIVAIKQCVINNDSEQLF